MVHPGTGEDEGFLRDTEPLSEDIGRFEAHAVNIQGQTIRIFTNQRDRLIPIGCVDAHGPGGADPCDCRNTMISRTTFCSAQALVTRALRLAPMPSNSVSRSGVYSMASKTCSPNAVTSILAK